MSDHWASSSRRNSLPANWTQLRSITRDRAHGQCEHVYQGQRCEQRGTDCDHINPGNDHTLHNLQWLCGTHHKAKTAREAAAAKASDTTRAKSTRPAERHPGLT